MTSLLSLPSPRLLISERRSMATTALCLTSLVALGAMAPACSDPPEQDPTVDGSAPGAGVAAPDDGSGASTSSSGGATSGGGATPSGGGTDAVGGAASPPAELPFGHPIAGATYPEYDGFELYLVEEFEEPLDLDSDPIWTWSDGGLTEGQVRFVKEQVSFADGKMRLEARTRDGSISADSCSHAEAGKVFTKPLFSGEMRTRYNIFRYGRYEVRMKAPRVNAADTAATGNFIATLFIFRTPKFQDWREIDIEVTGNASDPLTMNLIYGDNEPTWREGIQEVASSDPGFDPRDGFHDYAFEWLPDRITWFVDGEQVRENTAADGGLPIPEKSAKIMMNLWIFGPSAAFGGEGIADNQYPFHSEYEWFRFYRWTGDDQYPCGTLDAACLREGDADLSSNNPCDGIEQFGEKNGASVCVASCQ